MIFAKNTLIAAFGVASLASAAETDQDSSSCAPIESITCVPVSTSPTLDAKTTDWSSIDTFEAPLTGALNSIPYPAGNGHVKIQCVYDAEEIHFLFQIPGKYRFDTEDNHLCASISTMFKMGESATLYNMGNCPMAGDCEVAPEGCDPYKVDIGGHWELKTTEMGVTYSAADNAEIDSEAPGNDLKANNDDEYAVGPFCRFDDDDANAGNEWSGAWLHSTPTMVEKLRAASDNEVVEGDDEGMYIFEMSRTLTTASEETDAQLEAGKAIDFGFAFWDPHETEVGGWSDAGHYVTGCSKDWISLRLVDENGILTEEDDELATGTEEGGDPEEGDSNGEGGEDTTGTEEEEGDSNEGGGGETAVQEEDGTSPAASFAGGNGKAFTAAAAVFAYFLKEVIV